MIVDKNRAIFERAAIASLYAEADKLVPAEEAILARFRGDHEGKHVLDLGVGGGRTAPWLARSAASYVGLDFSHKMVEVCRKRYPEWRFAWGDARDLSAFDPATIDFVLFSFNGIDSVGDQDRRRILAEVARVLKPRGVFVFSSHNLDKVAGRTFFRSIFEYDVRPNPISLTKALARISIRLYRYARNARNQMRADDHAILVDPGHGFVLCHYYIGAEAQRRQLREAGFAVVEVVDDDGQPVQSSTASDFLYYVARKR